jgi:GAF domain-containing protein
LGVGFICLKDSQLILGPFQGKPACIRIASGEKEFCWPRQPQTGNPSWCGTYINSPDTSLCDDASASEIVIPIIRDDQLMGVLDIDSPVKARFSEEDRQGLQGYADILSSHIHWEDLLR